MDQNGRQLPTKEARRACSESMAGRGDPKWSPSWFNPSSEPKAPTRGRPTIGQTPVPAGHGVHPSLSGVPLQRRRIEEPPQHVAGDPGHVVGVAVVAEAAGPGDRAGGEDGAAV